jgi:ubiquitin carboxyl-terminal hydrolase 34
MFSYLELSDRSDYNPIDFCFSFKDFEGNPVDVGVQQDAQEFLNMILDRIETPLKTTPFKHLMDGIFGGKTCTQMTCTKCNYIKNKEETFLNLSLPMKN